MTLCPVLHQSVQQTSHACAQHLHIIPARSNSHPENLFLPSTQGSEAANEQTKSSFVMCGAAAVCASLTRSQGIQPWFRECESVSNVSKRPIVRSAEIHESNIIRARLLLSSTLPSFVTFCLLYLIRPACPLVLSKLSPIFTLSCIVT